MFTMKLSYLRHLVFASFLLLFSAVVIAKEGTPRRGIEAAPVISTINGNPLQIRVGDDTSFQVFNSLVPGTGQIFPDSSPGTGDMGWFVRTPTTLFAANFSEHGSTATGGIGTNTPFTPVSLSGVSGTGSSADPYVVTVVGALTGTGMTATLRVQYVNGDNYFTQLFTVNNGSGASQALKLFVGADIFLAASDSGVPYLEPTSSSPGGRDCQPTPTYSILLIPQTPASAYSAVSYSSIWAQIGTGQLDNTVGTGCQDNGAALQWDRTVANGASTTIQSAVSFGSIPTITQFSVSSVAPASGTVGTNVNVTISGIGFLPTTTFSFGAGITVNNLVIVNGTTATATLVISPAAVVGPRDVIGLQGSTPALTSTLFNGFTVIAGTVIPPAPVTPVPTLATWAVLLLGLLAAVIAARALVTRHRRQN